MRWYQQIAISLLVFIVASVLSSPSLWADISSHVCFPAIGCLGTDRTDLCLDLNQNGVYCDAGDPNFTTWTAGMVPFEQVGDPTFYVMREDNNIVWLDGSPQNGVHDDNEPILNWNQPTTLAGDELIRGSLTITDDLIVSNVPFPLEMKLFEFTTTREPSVVIDGGDCWPMVDGSRTPHISSTGSDPANRCRSFLPYDVWLTEMCGTLIEGTNPATNTCVIRLTEHGESSTVTHATFQIGPGTAGDLDAVGQTKCVAINAAVDSPPGDPESFYFITSSCNVSTLQTWPEIRWEIKGYEIVVP